jgi:uncharacterized protein YbaR (Trm112 family)
LQKSAASSNLASSNNFLLFMHKKLSPELLEILVCPLCKGSLNYDEKNNELICLESKLAYKIIDGIPVMLVDEARKIS